MLTKCTALWWKRSTKRVEQKLSSHRVHGCLIRARGRRLSENGFPLLSRSSDIWIHNVHGLNGRLDPFSSLRDFELLQEPPCSANEDLNKWSNKADDVLEDVKDIKKKQVLAKLRRLVTLRRSDTVVQEKETSRLHSRSRWDWERLLNFTWCCRTASRRGTVSTRKPCIGRWLA